MSEFVVEQIEGLNGKLRICKLRVDGICEFDEFVAEMEKTGRGRKLLASIMQILSYVAAGNRLPDDKFKPLKRGKGDLIPDYEVKKKSKFRTVRIYLFKDGDNQIIVNVGNKKNQIDGIARLRRIKIAYYEQK